VRTDATGAFTAWGPRTDAHLVAKLELGGEHLALLEPTDGFRWGERALALTVVATGSIEGHVLLDRGSGGVDVDVSDAGGADVDRVEHWETEDGLRFRVLALMPGTYALRFTGERSPGEAVVTDVHVAAGAPTLDPRLCPLDLRGRFERGATAADPIPPVLRFADAAGRPIEHGFVSFESDDEWSWPAPWIDGSIAVPAGTERVAAWGTGRRLAVRAAPTTDATWALEPAPVVRFVLDLPPSCRTPTLRFRAKVDLAMERAEPFGYFFDDGAVELAGTSEATMELPGIGRWRVEVRATWGEDVDLGRIEMGESYLDFAADPPLERYPLVDDPAAWEMRLRAAGAPLRGP
jgi:hypothetical protein